MHTVTLFIPALFWPHGDAGQVPTMPALRTLIGRGDVTEFRCDDEQAWLCERFGIARQADWPSAPIAVFGAGMPPGENFWLNADPVHLQVNRDQLIEERAVQLGLETPTKFEVLSGLHEGEQVMIGNRSSVHAGQKVSTQPIGQNASL